MIYLDIALAILLTVTIFYCFRLSKRINDIKHGSTSIGTLLKGFDESIKKAYGGIAELQRISKQANELIKPILHEAKNTADDLDYLTKRGSQMADELSKLLDEVRLVIKDLEGSKTQQKEVISAKNSDKNAAISALLEKISRSTKSKV